MNDSEDYNSDLTPTVFLKTEAQVALDGDALAGLLGNDSVVCSSKRNVGSYVFN